MRFLDVVDRIHVALGSLSGLATLVMILIVVPDIVLRKFFATTIPTASEINVMLLVLMVYLGLAGAEARGAHFRVTLLTDNVPDGVRRTLAVATGLLSLAGLGLLALMTTENAMKAVARGEASFGVYAFPIWPSRIAVAAGLWLLCLQILVGTIRAAAGRTGPFDGHPEGRDA